MATNQPQSEGHDDEPTPSRRGTWPLHPSASILIGLASGIGCGLFFGSYCAKLSMIGDAFVGLLRMTVLPYIAVSLVANLGKLPFRETRRLAGVGGLAMLLLWSVALLMVFVLPTVFPEWTAGSFYSAAVTDPSADMDRLDFFIPSNVFRALADNHVPAVVLACIFAGLALSGMEDRQQLITRLEQLSKLLMRVTGFITRLAPFGVFAIAASASGTVSFEEASRMQAYIVAYSGGALLLGVVVLPLLVTACTPFRYRDVWEIAGAPALTALATGKLIIVLPMLIERTEMLIGRYRETYDDEAAPAVDILYPIAYPFPHIGKLLAMLFIPFAAWFLGTPMQAEEYPEFLSAGLFAYFGGPILATPFLLDLMRLPRDMFQLFLLSGVYGERVGDALGAMHLAAFTLLTTTAFTGRLTLRFGPLAKGFFIVTLSGVAMIGGMRWLLGQSLSSIESKSEIIGRMQLIEEPVATNLLDQAAPNPDPLLPNESLLERIRRRRIIRVGFNADKLPFAFFNGQGTLVGFDVNMAHALARDLGVSIEFVPFDRATLAQQLSDDHFDVAMSGLVGTLERAEAMSHTMSYMDVTLALVVPDHRVRSFRSLDTMHSTAELKVGFADLSLGYVDRLRAAFPRAELIELQTNREFFDEDADYRFDALLISAESGSAFTLLYPEFEVVIPKTNSVSLPLFYAIAARDTAMRDFLDHWIELRRKDGTMQDFYDHWVLGKNTRDKKPRWCIARDVLHWID